MTIELRSAAVQQIDTDKGIIELIAVPWDEWTPVEYQGRIIEESFTPGAFGGITTHMRSKPGRWLVNLDHDPAQWVGIVKDLYPDDTRGLRAELKLRRTPAAEQAKLDCADGMYSGSVAFSVRPDQQTWEGRDRRRITNAWLEHIALTPTPAYQGAEVISVRSAPVSATPNLDRILAEQAAATYSDRVERIATP